MRENISLRYILRL